MTNAENYKGSHAVAIIGWGVEKDTIFDIISNTIEFVIYTKIKISYK